MRNCRWKSVSACSGRFWQPCSLFKNENDHKLCLSSWVALCPNMAARCRHKKVPPQFYLVRLCPFGAPPVGHMPNIDCVVCLWLWNLFVIILVTMNERKQVFRCKNIVALTYIFLPTLKKGIPYKKTGKENTTSFQTGPLLLSFWRSLTLPMRNLSHVKFSTRDNFLEHLFIYTPVINNNEHSKYWLG